MGNGVHTARELKILEAIEANPEITQASLAVELGVAVGTVNWHVKRLIKKGYVKVTQLQRRRLRYIVTPSGIALRSKLAVSYLQNSMTVYRKTRARAQELLSQLEQQGYDQVRIEGNGDLADVVRLTCLEHGMEVVCDSNVPVLRIEGLRVNIDA